MAWDINAEFKRINDHIASIVKDIHRIEISEDGIWTHFDAHLGSGPAFCVSDKGTQADYHTFIYINELDDDINIRDMTDEERIELSKRLEREKNNIYISKEQIDKLCKEKITEITRELRDVLDTYNYGDPDDVPSEFRKVMKKHNIDPNRDSETWLVFKHYVNMNISIKACFVNTFNMEK